MSISISGDINAVMNQMNASKARDSKAAALQSRLTSGSLQDASDEELMDVCKSFESYLVEQVMNKVRTAIVPKEEDEENDYLAMFSDKLYQEYADTISQNGELGLAQQLYEAMKRDYGGSATT